MRRLMVEVNVGGAMNIRSPRLMIAVFLICLLAIPVIGFSQGPPALNAEEDPTVRFGCTCHGNAAPGDRAIVMITGIPVMYETDQAYEFTINVADSVTLSGSDGNTEAGFLFSSNAVGDFSWDESQNLRDAVDNEDDVSHSEPGSATWTLIWTAPAEDVGAIHFWLVGNSVDGSGLPDEGDYWNILTFTINAPGTIVSGDSDATLQTRTIAVGDYDTLFLVEESEAEKRAEAQKRLSDAIFSKGNLFYWTTLTALIVGAVYQREILERRYGPGPEHLAMELAYPQGIRRSLTSIIAFVIAVDWTANSSQADFFIGIAWFVAFWAAYGVYRTYRSAMVEATVPDVM